MNTQINDHFELTLQYEFPKEYLDLIKTNYEFIEPNFTECVICKTDITEVDHFTKEISEIELNNGMCVFCLNDFEHPFIWF